MSELAVAPPASPAAPGAPRPPGGRWLAGWRLALVLLAAATVVHLPALSHRVLNADEAYLATQAQVLDRGGRLYVDTVDRKPPVVPYLYAGVFRGTGSDDLLPVRMLAILAETLTALLLAAEARRRFGNRQAGLVAGLLFLGSSAALFAEDVQAANFEVFMLPSMVAAVVLATRRRPLASGAATALATLTKQTAALTLVPVVWIVWHLGRGGAPAATDAQHRARTRDLALVTAGFVAPIIGAALVFGAHDFTRWVFTSNGGYLADTGALGFAAHLALRQWTWFLLANLAIVVLCALALRRRGRDDLDLWLWLAAGVVAVASGFRFFGHYYLQLVPPLALLATGPLVGASRRVLAVVAVAVLVPVAWFSVSALAEGTASTETAARELAAYARHHTRSAQRILVWGHLPELYWLSDRPPATRFETTGFLTGWTGGRPKDQTRVGMQYAVPGAWRDFESDLRAHPPALVFDLSPANLREAAYYPPAKFPRFERWLTRHYHRVATIDRVRVYAPS